MLVQEAAVKHKDAVACQMKQLAIDNFDLKLQNYKLWKVLERQRSMITDVQAEIDNEKEETEGLLSELQTENYSLRSLLQINEEFHSTDVMKQITEEIRKQEQQLDSE